MCELRPSDIKPDEPELTVLHGVIGGETARGSSGPLRTILSELGSLLEDSVLDVDALVSCSMSASHRAMLVDGSIKAQAMLILMIVAQTD